MFTYSGSVNASFTALKSVPLGSDGAVCITNAHSLAASLPIKSQKCLKANIVSPGLFLCIFLELKNTTNL